MVESKSYHFTCGEFSKKWFKSHHKIPWVTAEEKAVDFGQGQTFGDASGVDADMICVTLNETSTGVIIDDLPVVNEDQILAVDATSGGGQVPCDLSKVDCYFFSLKKYSLQREDCLLLFFHLKQETGRLKLVRILHAIFQRLCLGSRQFQIQINTKFIIPHLSQPYFS